MAHAPVAASATRGTSASREASGRVFDEAHQVGRAEAGEIADRIDLRQAGGRRSCRQPLRRHRPHRPFAGVNADHRQAQDDDDGEERGEQQRRREADGRQHQRDRRMPDPLARSVRSASPPDHDDGRERERNGVEQPSLHVRQAVRLMI